MNCDFVVNNIHSYFKLTLSEEDKENFALHVSQCEKCNKEVKQHEEYYDLLNRLEPGFEAPGEIIDELSDILMQLSGKVKKEEVANKIDLISAKEGIKDIADKNKKEQLNKKDTKKHTIPRKVVIALILLGIFAVAAFIFFSMDFNNDPWSVKVIKGKYTIDGVASNVNQLMLKENLLTNMDSQLIISVPEHGQVTVNENTLVSILRAKNAENKLLLKEGKITVTANTLLPDFSVEVKSAIIIDRGADYVVEIKPDNTVVVDVTRGLVDVLFNNILTPIGRGYHFEIKEGLVLGVPYRTNTSPLLVEGLDSYLYQNGGLEALNVVMQNSVEEDAITLWNLIKRVDKNELLLLYDKINQFYPVPEGVTKRRVLGLSQEVLDTWWKEIEWQL